MTERKLDERHLNGGQRLAIRYFLAAGVLFVAQIVFGLLAAQQYLTPGFLFEILDFNVTRLIHIDAMIVWMLFGFLGSVYWLLEEESGAPVVGLRAGHAVFRVLTTVVAVVVLVFLLVQYGSGSYLTLWFINEGREYIEAPRWADVSLVLALAVFFFNVVATFLRGRWTGIGGVLALDLIALGGLYGAGMFYTPNLSVDQFWWWWVIHLWVEATWEVIVGCLVAWALMKTLGASRHVVTTWLYIEVALMFGAGILGLGHHYFWIGTPDYWLWIGGFFSALEPIPLVAMVVHAIYDASVHRLRSPNRPALAWLIAQAFGNFLGAGVWGFMQTLPQINLFTHGTQWAASHGHLAFFGAYATTIIALFYLAVQQWRGNVWMGAAMPGGWRWKCSLGLLNGGVLGMTVALLVAGYVESFVERAQLGSTWQAYFAAQTHPWFTRAMWWRQLFGVMTALGVGLLIWDLLTIGRTETRSAERFEPETAPRETDAEAVASA